MARLRSGLGFFPKTSQVTNGTRRVGLSSYSICHVFNSSVLHVDISAWRLVAYINLHLRLEFALIHSNSGFDWVVSDQFIYGTQLSGVYSVESSVNMSIFVSHISGI